MTSTNGVNTELPQDHPLKAAQMPVDAKENARDWHAEAQRLDVEVKFWKTKYFEALQHSQSQSQVIAMLARPQMEQDAKQQAELLARLTGMQANH